MQVVKWPNLVLTTKSEPVEEVNEEINGLLDNMLEMMMVNDALGLSAPQVGVNKRVIVAKPEEELILLINPVIEVTDDTKTFEEEGCLSFPGTGCKIKRDTAIKVTGLDRQGKEISLHLNGLAARVIQHEVDHLDGITILQKADFMQHKVLQNRKRKYERHVKRQKRR